MTTRKLERIQRVWPFFAVLLLVYLCSLNSLRFVLDDWCQLPRLASLLRGQAPGWMGIVDNRWIGNPRIFFLTWLLQGAWARIWGIDTIIPYFLLGFGAHLASCLLLYRLLWRAGLRERTSALAALACLVTPTSSNALFWTNCWQFVLPVTGFMLLTELHTRPLRNRWADLAALSACAICTQFLGEQILPVLYAGFVWALVGAWRQRGQTDRRQALLRALIPAAAASLSLWIYWRRCVAPFFRTDNTAGSWSAAWEGLLKLATLHAGAFTPFSVFYGKGSVVPSPSTWGLIAAVALALGWRYLREDRNTERRSDVSLPPFLLAAGIIFILCQLPVMAGAVKGLRAAEYRYTYLSGLALTAALMLALCGAADRWADPRRARAVAAVEVAFVVYLSGLMIYDLRDIWGGQKRLDDRIWAKIDSQYLPEKTFIMTDSQTMAPLMPERSNAISDFKDDFGITCRLRATRTPAPAEGPLVTRRYQASHDYGDWMYLPAYRGTVYRATKNKILAIVFRYGPSFADLLAGKVLVFANFDDYKRYRAQEQIQFARWEISIVK